MAKLNNIDLLMELDAERLEEVPTKELRIPRLSKLIGQDFVVTVKAISARRFTELAGGVDRSDTSKIYDANVKVALQGMVDPSMKDKDLQERFKCSTPMELIEKLFRGGEIASIAAEITTLSGFGGDVIEEIKN